MPRKPGIYWYQQAQVVVIEQVLPGFRAPLVDFKSNRRCEWHGIELDCMAHPNTPTSPVTKRALRDFGRQGRGSPRRAKLI
jgi:hypothetical protein